jgi:hypothetical protein
MKASELFVISALILLVFALVARFVSASALGISVTWRGAGYVLSPSSICIALATALCFFGTIYSLWMLPFNRTATLWHFWLTAFGIGVFWLSFYRAGATLSNPRTAIWGVFAAPAIVLLAQVVFVWNLIQAISKVTRLHS